MCKDKDDLSVLFLYQSPRCLYKLTNLISRADDFIVDIEFNKSREAWVFSRFCIGYEELLSTTLGAAMSQDEPADAVIKIGAEIIDYQITEILDTGRERNKEYKEWFKQGRPIRVRDYHKAEVASLKGTLKAGIALKEFDFYFDYVVKQVKDLPL